MAAEQAFEFLQGLQERGLSELALDYLTKIESSELVDDDFKRQVPYHRSVVLIEQSRQTADPATRSKLLDEARSALQVFQDTNPDSVIGAEAQLQLGTVELSRGQQLAAQAEKLPATSAFEEQRMTLHRDARAMFDTARDLFERAQTTYGEGLQKKSPPAAGDNAAEVGRQEQRARIAQLRFLAAQTQFESAQTYPPDHASYRKLHLAAAEELAKVYDEFARTFLVGLYARLYEGRCYQALGQQQEALGCYEELLTQPNVLPPFRKLIASAVHRKAEVLLEQKKYDASIETATACLRDATSSEETEPEWLAVRYRLAESLRKKGESAEKDSLERRKLLTEARDAYRLVATTAGEYQAAARTAALSLARGGDEEKALPRTFPDAFEAGKDALASYNAAKLAVPTAEKNNPAALPELQAQMEQGKADARRYFRAATLLVDEDTDLKQLNEARYFLCWLDWENQDYYRAAVLGEFIARRYPDHPAASSAAKLAMASYERLYSQSAAAGGSAEATDFEARRMAQIAEFIARRWPGSDDAAAAQSVLVGYAIRMNRIEDAEKLLADASPESRPQLELQLGNAMWARYLALVQSNGESDSEARTALKESAIKYLRSGFDKAREDRQLSDLAAAAGLYLVQAWLDDEAYDTAIELLEDSEVGPLALIARQHPAAARPQFAIEAYKAALRSYVMSNPPQAEKALDVMRELEKTVDQNGGTDAQLAQIYIGLGVALQKQLEQLRASGKDQAAKHVAAAFSQFLEKIAAHHGDANWATRAWIAQTYYSLGAEGAGPAGSPSRLSDTSRAYLVKSRDAYLKLLAEAAKNPSFAPSANSVLAAKVQLGESYRALGQYSEALATFSEVLKEKESSLSVQTAAAYAYQQRGQAEGGQWLERAIHGGYKLKSTGQNRIWGWLKISQIAARAARSDPKYRDNFFEARANVARCRYLAAMKQTGAGRQRDLGKAKQSIQSLAQLYPDLGGERWRGEFDALLKQIQSAAGDKPVGIGEFTTAPNQATVN